MTDIEFARKSLEEHTPAAHGVKATLETLTDRIMNRAGDGPCPMESTVSGTDDIAEAFGPIMSKPDAMRKASTKKSRSCACKG